MTERASLRTFLKQVDLEISESETPDIVNRTMLEVNAASDGTGVGLDVVTVGLAEGIAEGALVGQ